MRSAALVFWGIVLSSAFAQAGFETGNGGDAVVCPQARQDFGNARAGLLDYFETEDLFGGILPHPSSESADARVRSLLTRLAKLDPDRATKYEEWYKTFESEAARKKGIELVDIPDSQHIALPTGCEIKQLVIQRAPEKPWDKRYTINQDLYDLLSAEHQAGIILHELIYREAIETGQQDSKNSRIFNGLVASAKLATMTTDEYLEFVRKWVGLPELPQTVNGIAFVLGTVELYPNGVLKSGLVNRNFHIKMPGGCMAESTAYGGYFNIAGRIEFHPNGVIKHSPFGPVTSVPLENGRCQQIWHYMDATDFYPTGVPTTVYSQSMQLPVFGGEIVTFHDKIEFYDSGRVKRGTLPEARDEFYRCKKIKLMTTLGELREFGCESVGFDEEGRVIVN